MNIQANKFGKYKKGNIKEITVLFNQNIARENIKSVIKECQVSPQVR